MDLFGSSKHQESTKLTIGNGEKSLFWPDSWNRRGSLKQLAPKLYNIASKANNIEERDGTTIVLHKIMVIMVGPPRKNLTTYMLAISRCCMTPSPALPTI
jgi:hypothetical protein